MSSWEITNHFKDLTHGQPGPACGAAKCCTSPSSQKQVGDGGPRVLLKKSNAHKRMFCPQYPSSTSASWNGLCEVFGDVGGGRMDQPWMSGHTHWVGPHQRVCKMHQPHSGTGHLSGLWLELCGMSVALWLLPLLDDTGFQPHFLLFS